ncbi:hypothetical protein CYMTET_45704 [Cymbomonas tetramitiformis]|uniref:Uncharacterized protein n=1 Tax=Cymbomonas tetramitiformis TaxID=36881 RepID=A0AAE0BXQ2_9CHLO|nr:hypothetical protein CYMTET_45704 [Cymbomonas tetramitiformis]
MNLSVRVASVGKNSALASLQSHLLSNNLTQRLSNSTLVRPRQQVSIRCFAQPRKKLPERSVQVCCTRCRTLLYKYKKGGTGSLVNLHVKLLFTAVQRTRSLEEKLSKNKSWYRWT